MEKTLNSFHKKVWVGCFCFLTMQKWHIAVPKYCGWFQHIAMPASNYAGNFPFEMLQCHATWDVWSQHVANILQEAARDVFKMLRVPCAMAWLCSTKRVLSSTKQSVVIGLHLCWAYVGPFGTYYVANAGPNLEGNHFLQRAYLPVQKWPPQICQFIMWSLHIWE